MARRSTLYSALLALACASLLAATASAATKVTTPPPAEDEARPPNGFELQGSNGYTISVSTYLDGLSGRGQVAITASRGKESAAYSAPAKVTPDAIRANFGSFGRVDLALHLSGVEKTAKEKCLHHSETYEAGTYEGSFEFKGEGGYTMARATQVAALPTLAFLGVGICNQQSSGESFGPEEPGARLKGISYGDGRVLKFEINKNRPHDKMLFTASLAERVRGIRIYRELSGVAPASSFRYGRKVRTATLAPPAPFSGSASLTRTKNLVSPLWSGNLSLAFPGHTVAIAGAAVHVSLEHARLTHGSEAGAISFGI
jgi:hypothetical protein